MICDSINPFCVISRLKIYGKILNIMTIDRTRLRVCGRWIKGPELRRLEAFKMALICEPIQQYEHCM